MEGHACRDLLPSIKHRESNIMQENRNKIVSGIVICIAALTAVVVLAWWLFQKQNVIIEKNIPGMDRVNADKYSVPKPELQIGEFFLKGDGVPAVDIPQSWKRFRGGDFDNICKQNVKLADKWPEGGPKILWRVKLGEGHAAPVIQNGRVYLLDYDEEKKGDALRCLSLDDGKEIWRRWYRIKIKRNHGMSRTVPAVNEKYVVTIGPRCQVMCVKADSGDLLWGLDLEKDFGTDVPLWYTGQCALIDDSIAVMAPAGKDILIMGVDCKTGSILWKTPNPKGWKMSHSSIIPMTFYGKKMYVYASLGGIFAVSAEKEDVGTLMWESTAWNNSVIAPSPVAMGNGKIMLTAGYGGGSMVLQIMGNGAKFDVKVLQKIRPSKGLACEQQTPIMVDDKLYAVMPKDAGSLRKQFVCVKADDITKILWSSGKTNRYGLGPFIVADRKFYILNDNGVLSMIRAGSDKFEELGKAKVLKGHDAWGPIAIAGTRMLLRDSTSMVCIDVGE